MQQEQLYDNIFKRDLNHYDTELFLKDVVQEYPYFGLAHYFLLKTKNSGTAKPVAPVSEKNTLFFRSRFFMENLLAQNSFDAGQDKNVAIKNDILQPAQLLENSDEKNNAETNAGAEAGSENEKQQASPVEAGMMKQAPAINEELLFEPLHASDYFASQGIKLSDDMLGSDKLGKQLKSFTAWLKTMKKVQPGRLGDTGIATETAMQTLAEKSNIEEVIVTEAMAEACLLQGKTGKSIEIYEKLSLQNPAKSAYFAAKIESLKQ